MKNRLTKIWGVVLVLVVLAAMLIPAMPASAAVINMTWSSQGAPSAIPFNQFVPSSTNASQRLWDVAPDGKTMFALINPSTAVVGVNAIGAATMNVVSTAGFPASGSFSVASQATPVTYTGVTPTAFTGIPAASITAATVGAEVVTANVLYKSADGGLTFSNTGVGAGLATVGTVVALAVSSDYANDATVVVATGAAGTPANLVYRSVNGGAVFGALPAVVTAGNITSVAVGPNYSGGQAILAGTSNAAAGGGAARLTTTTLTWTNLGFGAVDVYAVAFSPNTRSDAEVLAVTADAVNTYLQTKLGTNAADADIARATIAAVPSAATTRASMAFPADYSWSDNNRTFVGLGVNGVGNAIAAVVGDDVYRVNGGLGVGPSLPTDLNVGGVGTNTNIYSISFKGNLADGWLYVGQHNSPTIWRATSTGGTVVSFIPNAKAPTGSYNTIVEASAVAADTSIFVMTSGFIAAPMNISSALSVSNDGASTFNQISLIAVSALGNVKFQDLSVIDANTQYLVVWDDADASGAFSIGDVTSIFKTANAGLNWQGVWVRNTAGTEGMNKLYPSPAIATDNTIYVTQNDSRIWKTSNAGGTFTGYSSPNSVAITAFVPIDANTYYVGAINAIYKSGSFIPATVNGETPNTIGYVSATDMFVGTTTGSVYESTNGGTSFVLVGAPGAMGGASNVFVLPDVGYDTNKMVYAGSTAAGIFRFTIGTSTSWTQIGNAGGAAIAVVNSMSQVADGSLYVSDATVNTAKVWRCVTPTSLGPATWDQMAPNVGLTGLAGYPAAGAPLNPNSVKVSAVATGTAQVPNNTVYNLVNQANGPFIYGVQDTAVAAPAITSPVANAQVATPATFTWVAAATVGPVKYDFQVAYDVAFSNLLVNQTGGTAVTGTLNPNIALTPGQTYYWRVRVGVGNPMASKWSAATKFSALLAQSGNSLVGAGGTQIYPAAGAINIPQKPVFQWAAVSGAVSYDLQVADNPVFVNPLDNQTGLNTTVWTETKTLDNAKTYYWRVRAVSASGVASDWVAQAFTVAPAAVAAPTGTTGPAVTQPVPTYTLVVPTQPAPTYTITVPPASTTAPSTPASIWVLIAIGAILIIAVIVLIARTRRV